MLTKQMLQQILIDSEIAQQFFHEAQTGLFFNDKYNDLFYDSKQDKICSQTFLQQPSHFPNEQMILRIHGQEPTQYIWPDLDYKAFISLCLQEYGQFFHQDLSQQQQLDRQQELHQQHQKGLSHKNELEL